MSATNQRVFLMDGQAVYLEGDGEITEEVLQQALCQLARQSHSTIEEADPATLHVTGAVGAAHTGATVHTLVEEGAVAGGTGDVDGAITATLTLDDPAAAAASAAIHSAAGDSTGAVLTTAEEVDGEEDEEEGVLAVLQDENGHQQTVRLTPDQAAALGINYSELLAAASMAAQGDEEGCVDDGTTVNMVTDAGDGGGGGDDNTAAVAVAGEQHMVTDANHHEQQQQQQQDQVTYTFEVVDDKGVPVSQPPSLPPSSSAAAANVHHTSDALMLPEHQSASLAAAADTDTAVVGQHRSSQLLAKSRQIMVPQVRGQQHTHPSPGSLRTAVTPTPPNNNNNNTRKIVTANSQGFRTATPASAGPPYRTLKTAVTPSLPTNSIKSAVKPVLPASTLSAAAVGIMSSLSTAAAGGDNEEDLPVILTPMVGQTLPDFIEPRPGLKILVRPLDDPTVSSSSSAPPPGAAAGGGGAGQRPIGSSDNPIQLVQQGNTFKSLQPLNANQLKQIATVLQQSRLNIPANTKNTIYDSDTKTRIVYRVVYPDESGRGRERTARGRGGRAKGRGQAAAAVRQSRLAAELDSIDQADADWSPSLEMNRDAKKRSTTKTRTGRLSKPPKYMVKDYRHIHRLDLNAPDLDDSDGGYSEWDYDELDEDNDKPVSKITYDDDASNDGESKPARAKRPIAQSMRDRFGCRTCGALCIGYMRLEGHFRKNPTHERPPYIPTKAETLAAAKKRPGKVGRPPGSSKRARLDDTCDGADTSADWGPEEVFAVMVELAEGRMDKLFDTVAQCTRLFRQYVAGRLAAVGQTAALAVTNSSAQTVHVNADRASLCGLPEGVYLVDTSVPAQDDYSAGPLQALPALPSASSSSSQLADDTDTHAVHVINNSSSSNGDSLTGLHIASVKSECAAATNSSGSTNGGGAGNDTLFQSLPVSEHDHQQQSSTATTTTAAAVAAVGAGVVVNGSVVDVLDDFVDDLVNSSSYHFDTPASASSIIPATSSCSIPATSSSSSSAAAAAAVAAAVVAAGMATTSAATLSAHIGSMPTMVTTSAPLAANSRTVSAADGVEEALASLMDPPTAAPTAAAIDSLHSIAPPPVTCCVVTGIGAGNIVVTTAAAAAGVAAAEQSAVTCLSVGDVDMTDVIMSASTHHHHHQQQQQFPPSPPSTCPTSHFPPSSSAASASSLLAGSQDACTAAAVFHKQQQLDVIDCDVAPLGGTTAATDDNNTTAAAAAAAAADGDVDSMAESMPLLQTDR